MIEFYETHFKKFLLIQESKQEKFKILEKNYNNDDFANHQTTEDSFENNDSDPQNISEVIEMPNNDENKNASNNIRIEKKKADLLISMKSDLKAPRRNNLQIPEKNDLQTGEPPNLMKAPENRADEGGPQAASDFAKERIPKFRRHKTVAPTATFEKPQRERRAYDPKTFDKKKTPIALVAKSASGRIIKLKTYQKTIIDSDKKK